MCYHCFKVTFACSIHSSCAPFWRPVECPFAPNKKVNKFQVWQLKQRLKNVTEKLVCPEQLNMFAKKSITAMSWMWSCQGHAAFMLIRKRYSLIEINTIFYISGPPNSNRHVCVCLIGRESRDILFVWLAIINMQGYVISSGQCHVVSSGQILRTGRRPGGNEIICPCGLWELLQCRTLWAFFVLLHALCWCCSVLVVTHQGVLFY